MNCGAPGFDKAALSAKVKFDLYFYSLLTLLLKSE